MLLMCKQLMHVRNARVHVQQTVSHACGKSGCNSGTFKLMPKHRYGQGRHCHCAAEKAKTPLKDAVKALRGESEVGGAMQYTAHSKKRVHLHHMMHMQLQR